MPKNYWHKFKPHSIYHIYNRSIDGVRLFETVDDYQFFIDKYKEVIAPFVSTIAYVLIPNHFHFAVKILSETEIRDRIQGENFTSAKKYLTNEIGVDDFLANQFRRLFSSYSLTYNNKYYRRGAVFQSKYKRIEINDENQLKTLIAYCHHNPIHHFITDTYGDYTYSSYNAIIKNQASSIDRAAVLALFGSLESFIDYHKDYKERKEMELRDRKA